MFSLLARSFLLAHASEPEGAQRAKNMGVAIPPKKDVLVWIHDSVLELSTESLGLTGRATQRREQARSLQLVDKREWKNERRKM